MNTFEIDGITYYPPQPGYLTSPTVSCNWLDGPEHNTHDGHMVSAMSWVPPKIEPRYHEFARRLAGLY